MRTFLLTALFGVSLTPAATMYTVVDLGSLGGTSSVAYRINGTGSVVGWSSDPLNDNHAFSTAPANSLHDLNLSSASSSYAYDINGSGQVVGTSYIGGVAHGTVWTGSGATDLGANTFGLSINSSGEVAGGNGHAFVFANGTFQDLGTLAGGNWSSAYGVNDGGMVAGYGMVSNGTFRAFTWTPGSGMTMLGTLGGKSSYAMAINNQGQIAGHSTAANGYEHAFMSTNGTLTDLGTLGGNSYAYGINDAGVVVGYSGSDAFVYCNGSLYDLNSIVAANSGWQLDQAYGINDAGQIVGTGTYQGQSHAFVLDPINQPASVPEPGTVVLIGIGIALVVLGRYRRTYASR
jgi:probable HAF family extracellular repeat protein